MADPIEIRLIARGVAEMQQTFRSVEQTITAFERNSAAAGERGARARTTAVQREGSDKEKAYAKVAKEAERWERERVRAAEKAAKDSASATEKSTKEEVRAVEKAERDKQREVDKTARYMASVRERSAAMAGRLAIAEADTQIREAERVAAARTKFARNIGGMITGSVGGAVQGVVGMGRGLVSNALQVGGGFSIADSVQRELKLSGQAATLAASSQADADGKKWKSAEILKSARGTANALSMDPEEVMKGIGKYKDLTGNLGDAVKLAPSMAKLATALGADTGELMENAGNAYNAGLRGDDVMKLARVQTMQGMQGAVELKDMAKYGSRLTGGASLFGGDRATNIATMGALAQTARQHGPASTAAEATMGAMRFATDVAKHSKALEKQGIKVSDGHGSLLGADVIMRSMLEKTGGDVTKLSAMGLGDRGIKPLMGFASIYRDAMGGTREKGETDASFKARQEKGKAAVLAEFDKYTKGVSDSDIDSAAKERLGEADKQVERAMNELRDAVGTQLLPEFMKLIPVLTQLMPQIRKVLEGFVSFADWFAGNPIKGLGAVVLASVSKDMAAAGIGEAVKRAITAAIGGGGGGAGGAGGAAGGALGKLGGGSSAAGGAVVAGAAAQAAALYELGKGTIGAAMAGKEQGKEVAAMLASADPSTRAEGEKRLAAAKKTAGGRADGATSAVSAVSRYAGILAGPVGIATNAAGDAIGKAISGKSESERTSERIAASELVNTVELRKKIAEAVTGGVADGLASKAGTPGSAGTPTRTQPLSARP